MKRINEVNPIITSYHLTAKKSGIRLDKFIGENCPDISRTRAQILIRDGYVTVNNQAAKPSLKLEIGDLVEVTIPPPTPTNISPEAIPLKIIYEDKDLIVVDKPAGLTVHPAPGHYTGTLANAILAHLPGLEAAGPTGRALSTD